MGLLSSIKMVGLDVYYLIYFKSVIAFPKFLSEEISLYFMSGSFGSSFLIGEILASELIFVLSTLVAS